MQRIGIDVESICERIERKVSRMNAIVLMQHIVQDTARARVELAKTAGVGKRLPALGFGITFGRVGRAEAANEHRPA